MNTTWQISKQDQRVQQLMRKDTILASLIEDIGNIERNLRPDPLKSI